MHEIVTFLRLMISSNFVNFIIMLMILALIVSKMQLGKKMDEACCKIDETIKESEHQKLKSVRHLTLVQNAMERLPVKIEEMKQDFCTKTVGLKQRIDLSNTLTIDNINKNIDKSIEVEERKLSQEMTQTVIKNSVDEAVSKIKQALAQDPNLHYRFINESLEELSRNSYE